ncbi:hypothetical protein FJW08_16435 [Mesorhizobium sp. B3-2-1]|uniref:hypothetical protein n=1 Tax=unclassified Mesorhizobium TaxID=325217 RepID=UPI0011278223|nr:MULTISPECIES: hypothetical protein [unclassified Mesorhizobium]MBZ9672833.1 hypothetical protein [Mesorhizobium sp. ES1-3]TPI29859.1 hypothetical protein FJW08_16435 [Mesorhizobium sp. B3-2-1]
MRKLEKHEEIGLIGYPYDGEYLAVVDSRREYDWILGGDLCELDGASLADQAANLPRYYPDGSRLVLATIKGDMLVALRDY